MVSENDLGSTNEGVRGEIAGSVQGSTACLLYLKGRVRTDAFIFVPWSQFNEVGARIREEPGLLDLLIETANTDNTATKVNERTVREWIDALEKQAHANFISIELARGEPGKVVGILTDRLSETDERNAVVTLQTLNDVNISEVLRNEIFSLVPPNDMAS